MNCGDFRATETLFFPYADIDIVCDQNLLFQNELVNLLQDHTRTEEPEIISPKILRRAKSGEHSLPENKLQALSKLKNVLNYKMESSGTENFERPELSAVMKEVKEFKEQVLARVSIFSLDPMEEKNKSMIHLNPVR